MTTSPLGAVCPKQLAADSPTKKLMDSMFNNLINRINSNFLLVAFLAPGFDALSVQAVGSKLVGHVSATGPPKLG